MVVIMVDMEDIHMVVNIMVNIMDYMVNGDILESKI
eukprot:CAMPEP_0201564318 /NCGR_PEP_ID=MMETSP0190_2-20130828/2519_1 /ASSEMBLY_ACC=CAM_ASM_000263 /TAXON_ID=37353 /ORGANISM="Rosalina sp." /LENGTH=35 /DNA_ID= /DNA_START= /DNA_END= /DNA_ORIENTATION=